MTECFEALFCCSSRRALRSANVIQFDLRAWNG